MNAGDLTAEEAISECLSIAARCAGASADGRYADGYRAAAADIHAAIEARFGKRPGESWERDLRDLEIEARTMSRVLGLLRKEQARSSSALVRNAIAGIIRAIDDEVIESSIEVRDAG